MWRPLRPSLFGAFALAVTIFCGANVHATPPVKDVPLGQIAPTPAQGATSAAPVANYTLSAKLDPNAHTVAGSGTLTWTNTSSAPVSELWFHLYLNAFKNQRSVYLREPLGSGRGGGPVSDWGTIDVRRLFWREMNADLWPSAERSRPGDDDETDVRVPLPRPVAPGELITLDMAWDDKLPSIVERTGYYGTFHFVGQWFPKIARLESDGSWTHFPFHRLSEFYSDYGTYDVTLDVPEKFVVGATGTTVEEKVAGGRRTSRHLQSDIHDFAWTAWDGYRVAQDRIGNVNVRLLFPPGYERAAARSLDSLRLSLPHFARRYGQYPYPVLTVVHPPEAAREAGGMEYPTLITTGGWWWAPRGLRLLEAVTIHEFGHQYFYGLFASNENRWPFLDEGLNTYAEHEAMRTFYGAGDAFDMFGLRVSSIEAASVFADGAASIQPVAQPAPRYSTFDLYGRLVYARTAAILETLGRVYGTLRMESALRAYGQRARFAHPTPDTLLSAVEAATSKEASENLRIALFEKGWVDFEVLDVQSRPSTDALGIFDRAGKRETVSRRGSKEGSYDGFVLLARKGTLTIPVEVQVVLDDGSSQHVAWDGRGDTTRLDVHGPAPIRFVNVDPDRRVLIDRNPRNNFARVAEAPAASTFSSLERLAYWASNILALVMP